MKPRLTALLVHGMGHDRTWWDPVVGGLAELGIAAVALDMPSLEAEGPEAWVDEITEHIRVKPVMLIGHSLGAAACLQASLRQPVDDLVLLACPFFSDHFYPVVPPSSRLSTRAIARVGRFLKVTSDRARGFTAGALHFVGGQDPFVPAAQAQRFPFRTVMLPEAGHELNRAAGLVDALLEHIAGSSVGREHLDPGMRARFMPRGPASLAVSLGLSSTAPSPSRLDIEITTRCQLECPLCARTLYPGVARHPDMELPVFEKLLGETEHLKEVFFVGLGEPLLHPGLLLFVERAAQASVIPRLVTNGLLAGADTLARLRDKGLAEVTFSIDSIHPERFRRLKGGADLGEVLDNFGAVPDGLAKSVFVTLSRDNVDDLPGLVDLAAANGLRAIAVTDANFEPNRRMSVNAMEDTSRLAAAIAYARERRILLISPHFHNFDSTLDSLRRCRLRDVADLSSRCVQHTHCLAPWRIAVVGANSHITPCNCAPGADMGDLARDPFMEIWNAAPLQSWRDAVLRGTCAACLACPRY